MDKNKLISHILETARKRIIDFIENQEIRPSEFLDKTGLKKGFIDRSHQESGATDIYLAKILEVYPEINAEWLLTGHGSMVRKVIQEETDIIEPSGTYLQRTDGRQDLQEVNLYDFQAAAGINSLFNHHANVLGSIKVPNLPKCDGAISIVGDSMYPLLKSGDIVIYKMVQNLTENIFWGEMYLLAYALDGDEIVTVKYVQKSDLGSEYIRLVSQNSNHQPKDIKIKGIIKMAIIKASIRINGMA